VHLRRPTARDRDRFIEAVKASRSLHGSWVHAPGDAQSFAAFLRRAHTATDERVLVCRNEDGAITGTYHLSQIFRGPFRNAYLGYYAFVPHAGTGLMRAAMPLVFDHAFTDLGLHRLQASVQPENGASRRLLEATGWREEGFARRYLFIDGAWRDHVVYAITAEDVTPQEA
jgi:ribosomal-protein-alanine N-acetyltransferase